VPNSLAIIGSSFEDEQRGKAIGTWAGLTSVTLILGPVLGGYLVENVSWRAVFFINIPLAIVILAIAFSHVPESKDEQARRLDLLGAALTTVGLGGLVFGLLESSRVGLGAPLVVGSISIGVIALAAFVIAEGRVREPMMPLSLFRSRNFSGANVFTLLLYFALGGTLFFLPFNLIWVQGYSATAAGAATVPAILLMSVLSRYTGGLTDRFGKAPAGARTGYRRGRLRPVRHAEDRGLVLGYVLPGNDCFGDRALYPGSGGYHGSTQLGGYWTLGAGFCDQ
jgi:MFS family permease